MTINYCEIIPNLTVDYQQKIESSDRFNQYRKRHPSISAKYRNEKTNEQKRQREGKKVKYYERGKTVRHARTVESKCEKYIVKISTISKYNIEQNEFSSRKNTLSSNDLIICRNYRMSNFLWKKYEKEYEEGNKMEVVRNEKEKAEEEPRGNENTSSKLHLNWVHSMSDGGNNNVMITEKERKEEETNEQEDVEDEITVNDKLKDAAIATLLEHNESVQPDENLNDNVGEQNNIMRDKSTSAATLFNINLHSMCHFTKTIPKHLLRIARISKEMLVEELRKREIKRTRNKNAASVNETNRSDRTINVINSSNNERNEINMDTSKSLAVLCLENINVISSYLHAANKG